MRFNRRTALNVVMGVGIAILLFLVVILSLALAITWFVMRSICR